jgi:hypothetical protein
MKEKRDKTNKPQVLRTLETQDLQWRKYNYGDHLVYVPIHLHMCRWQPIASLAWPPGAAKASY